MEYNCKQWIPRAAEQGARGAIAPPLFTDIKIKPCWLAKLSGLKHTHKADSDCDKKTLAHYNSYL